MKDHRIRRNITTHYTKKTKLESKVQENESFNEFFLSYPFFETISCIDLISIG